MLTPSFKRSERASEFRISIYRLQLFLRFRLSFHSSSPTFKRALLRHLHPPLLPLHPLAPLPLIHTLSDKR
jgi:hypothetical protein